MPEDPKIHQYIFAAPKPGMSEKDFQNYWVQTHAIQYASKIQQIRKYCVDTRMPWPNMGGEPIWSGAAEIWLQNEQEQLASLQTREFLEGARRDEPNWAAFWKTLALDTTAHVLLSGGPEEHERGLIKLLVLSKRKEGLPLESFRACFLGTHASRIMEIPGICRYVQGHVRDSAYSIGEAPLDCVEQICFDSSNAAIAARSSTQWQLANVDYSLFAEERYVHMMLTQQHWIIGPQPRPYAREALQMEEV